MLDKRSFARAMQVHILEDDESHLHIRNLSLHRCDTEEQALNMASRACT